MLLESADTNTCGNGLLILQKLIEMFICIKAGLTK